MNKQAEDVNVRVRVFAVGCGSVSSWSRHLGGSDKQGGEMVFYNDRQINRDTVKTPQSDNGRCKHNTKSFLCFRQNMKPNLHLQHN